MKSFYSGYIEGYYGKELDWNQRKKLIYALKSLGLNTYIYAPKNDPYHRINWKQPYPVKWLKEFKALARVCKKSKIRFVGAVAPGLSMDYISVKDYQILLKKIFSFLSLGADSVALLMDDIQKELPPNCNGIYHSLGEAHGVLLKKLKRDTRKKYPNCNLWFCPTVYTDEFVKGKVRESVYLQDLSKSVPRDVFILWTGPGIISQRITESGTRDIQKLFPGRVVIWDNYYANDYCPRKIFLGKYSGRSSKLKFFLKGLLLNPTGMYYTDLLYLKLLACCLKNGNPLRDWKKVISSLGLPPAFLPLLSYFESPFRTGSNGRIKAAELRRRIEAVDELIFAWNSPLLREWFPFLQGLKQDLMLGDPELSRVNKKKLISKFPDSLQPFLRKR